MDIENVKSWASQPDVCRCCLSASGTWDVTASYLTDSAIKEVYLEMLRDCYGINLSYTTEWGPSRMVCKLCVGHLREACNFREQVLTAEKHFMDYWASRDNLAAVEIKIEDGLGSQSPPAEGYLSDGPPRSNDNLAAVEIKTEDGLGSQSPPAEGYLSDGPPHSDDKEKHTDTTIDAPAIPINSEKENKSKRKKQKGVGGRRKKKKIEIDYDSDSDVPIAALLEKNAPSANGNKADENDVLNETTSLPVKARKKNTPRRLQETKAPSQSIADNRSLRSNITLVLKHTTIIPFRYINNSKFACLYCDDGFLQFHALKSHMETHRNITEHEIQSTLKTPRDLVKADISEISCKICFEKFESLENVIEHLVESHKKIYHQNLKLKPAHGILGFDLSSDELKCNVCQKDFRFFKNLSVHMYEHSTSSMCHVCGKKIASEHRLQTHLLMHKRTHIYCKHCFKDFPTVAARNYHIRKEHNDASYKFPECKESFTQYEHRLKHLVEQHELKKPEFKCDVRNRELASSGGLAAHKRSSYLKTKQYTCEICGKVFAYKGIWQRHMDVHTGVKRYECKFCSKKFAKSYSLQTHERIHLDDKRHVCTVCKAAFVHKSSLKNHAKVHHPTVDVAVEKGSK